MQIDSAFGDHGPMPNILLVEDNPLHVRLVRSMLVDVWPDVDDLRHTRKLETAITLIRESEPECILLDLILPDAEGLEAVNALLNEAPNVPIVVLSSHQDDILAMEAIGAGAQDYLVKGTIGPEVLAKSIQFAIQRHRFDSADATTPNDGRETAVGMAILDDKGALLFSEPSVADMFGRPVNELVGSSVVDLVHANDLTTMEDALRGSDTTVELRMLHASGSDFRVRIELVPFADGARDAAAFLAGYYPLVDTGTGSSGGAFAVMSDWVGA
jgi:two-component system sensor histidine kinase UhpB